MNIEQLNKCFEDICPNEKQKMIMYIKIKNEIKTSKKHNGVFLKFCVSFTCCMILIFSLYIKTEHMSFLKPLNNSASFSGVTLSDENITIKSNEQYNIFFDCVKKAEEGTGFNTHEMKGDFTESKTKVCVNCHSDVKGKINIPEDLSLKSEIHNEDLCKFIFENTANSRNIIINVYSTELYRKTENKNVVICDDLIFEVSGKNITNNEFENLIKY